MAGVLRRRRRGRLGRKDLLVKTRTTGTEIGIATTIEIGSRLRPSHVRLDNTCNRIMGERTASEINDLTRKSEKVIQCFGGFFGALLEDPVAGVLQDDGGHICSDELGLLS